MNSEAQGSSRSRRRYRIRVAGRLDERVINGVAEVELGQSACGSTLEGPFVDQSQLRGLLNRLWQLGIEVLGFETYVPNTEDSEEDVPPSAAERPTSP